MRIAEIYSPDQQQHNQNDDKNDDDDDDNNNNQQQQLLLSRIERQILEIENLSLGGGHSTVPETTAAAFRQTVTDLSHLTPFQNSTKLQIWKLSFRLHNACIDISNAAAVVRPSPSASVMEQNAVLRHIAADMLSLAADVSGVPSPAIKSASFYYKAGTVWLRLKRFDLASSCFERGTEVIANLDLSKILDAEERKLLLDINLARSRTAWELLDKNLAVTLLNRAKKTLLFNSSDHYKRLGSQYTTFGRNELSKNEVGSSLNEALKLMNEALDLAEKGAAAARTRDQSVALKELKSETLRFIAAAHLKKGEYEGVIKCVKVLREGGCEDSGAHHAALCVLAMRGWLGLERYGEAEKELRGLVVNSDIPESVWVSSIEAYFNAVGGTAGAETVKGVFIGLLGRCHVSAGAAVRLARRVLGDSSCSGVGVGSDELRVRARVVAELVSDDRVVALFSGGAAAKERSAMHTVLWNWYPLSIKIHCRIVTSVLV